MKAVMYHYVRPVPDGLPYFRYLHLDHFRRQLDWFAEDHAFPSRETFIRSIETKRACSGVVLTFDDALADHFEHVFPELQRRGLWGIFYVPTGMYETGKLLDVHRIHLVLGRLGGARAMELLHGLVSDDMLSHAHVEDFHRQTYTRQDNSAATDLFKRTLNYFIAYEHRERVLDELMQRFFREEGELEAGMVSRYYASPSELRAMHQAGMEIGSHGVSHFSMAKLDPAEQSIEIARSFDFLGNLLGERPRTFCHPYGGFHNFTEETERLLSEAGCLFSFNVEQRDVADADLRDRPHALPRFDCNQFPHGKAHMGAIPSEKLAAVAETG